MNVRSLEWKKIWFDIVQTINYLWLKSGGFIMVPTPSTDEFIILYGKLGVLCELQWRVVDVYVSYIIIKLNWENGGINNEMSGVFISTGGYHLYIEYKHKNSLHELEWI